VAGSGERRGSMACRGGVRSAGRDVTPETTFSRTCHISEQTLSQRWSISPKLRSTGRATPPSKHFLRYESSAPKLLFAARAISPSKHFLRDGASAPKLLSAGRATSPSKHFLRDGASAPKLLSAGPPGVCVAVSGAARRGLMTRRGLRDGGRWRVGSCATGGDGVSGAARRAGNASNAAGNASNAAGNASNAAGNAANATGMIWPSSTTHHEHDTPRARHTSSTTHIEHDTPRARHTSSTTHLEHDTPRARHTSSTTHL